MSQGLAALSEVVAAQVLVDAVETSRRLTDLGIPHALIGGLAVGLHGHPRATKAVDFLVGDCAFERLTPFLVYRNELRNLVRVGVIDLMPLPTDHPQLSDDLSLQSEGEIPVIPPESLILLKLLANRAQDRADVSRLIEHGAELTTVTDYLRKHAPDLLPRFAEILASEQGGGS